jgi:hypothetical protein
MDWQHKKCSSYNFRVRNDAVFPMLDTISTPPKTRPNGGLRCFTLQLIYDRITAHSLCDCVCSMISQPTTIAGLQSPCTSLASRYNVII